MPRPRKPHKLKLLEGTDRADRIKVEVELPEPDGYAPPEWLEPGEATKTWELLTGLLAPVRVLSAGDLLELAHLCQLHSECVDLWVKGKGGPTMGQLSELRRAFGEFGLTPASRSKAGVLGSEKKTPFSEFRKAE